MKGLYKFHTTLITVQVVITLVSLTLSSLYVLIKQPFLVYFWYISLCGIVTMLATSFLVGLAIMFSRIFFPKSTKVQASNLA